MIVDELVVGLVFWVASALKSPRWGWRWGACVFLGGLAGYNYASLGLPGSPQLLLDGSLRGVFGLSLLGTLVGLGVAWVWSRVSN